MEKESGESPGSAIEEPNKTLGVASPSGNTTQSQPTHYGLVVTLSALALAVFLFAGYVYWDEASRFEMTDDAFIDARQFAVAPKVAGYVREVLVTDNQHVKSGETVARIGLRDYSIALKLAEAQFAAAQASTSSVEAQIATQRAQVGESKAQVAQVEAALRWAEEEAARSRALVERGTGTVQREQQTSSSLAQEQSNREKARRGVTAAQAQVLSLEAQRKATAANLEVAKAKLDKAKLDLAYTNVEAAQDGRIVRLSAAVGQYVEIGAALSMFVPDDIWVTANYKETQLDEMRVGQKVTLRIDAYPERLIHGHVASIQPGSGAAFSLLPAENATGNYIKIVQRVPVKIVMDDPPTDVALGPGMSAVPSVRVNPKPSLYERLFGER